MRLRTSHKKRVIGMKMDEMDYKVSIQDENNETIYEKVCHGISAAYEFLTSHLFYGASGWSVSSLEAGNAA